MNFGNFVTTRNCQKFSCIYSVDGEGKTFQFQRKAFLVPKPIDKPQTRGEINCADASNILVARSEERKAGEERKCLHSTNDAFWSKEETVSQQMMNSKFSTRPRGSHFSYFIEQQASLSMYSAIIYKRQTLSSPPFNTDSDNIERQLSGLSKPHVTPNKENCLKIVENHRSFFFFVFAKWEQWVWTSTTTTDSVRLKPTCYRISRHRDVQVWFNCRPSHPHYLRDSWNYRFVIYNEAQQVELPGAWLRPTGKWRN